MNTKTVAVGFAILVLAAALITVLTTVDLDGSDGGVEWVFQTISLTLSYSAALYCLLPLSYLLIYLPFFIYFIIIILHIFVCVCVCVC